MSAFPIKRANGKYGAVVTHTKKSKDWEKIIRAALVDAPNKIEGPLDVFLRFYLKRPKSVKRPYPVVKPDPDKLERPVLDALKGVITDDGQIINLWTTKRYAKYEGNEGVSIDIRLVLRDEYDEDI